MHLGVYIDILIMKQVIMSYRVKLFVNFKIIIIFCIIKTIIKASEVP